MTGLDGAIRTTCRLAEVYDIHNTALFKALRLDRLTSQEKSAGARNGPTFYALTKSGFDLAKIDWSVLDWATELGVPTIDEARLCAPDGRWDNREARNLVTALLNLFDDIKPFAHYAVRSGGCTMASDYALDLSPLANHDDRGAAIARALFDDEFFTAPYEALSRTYTRLARTIFASGAENEKPLLAPHAVAVLKHWTDHSLGELQHGASPTVVTDRNVIGFIQATKRMLELLYKRYPAITNTARRERMRRTLDDSLALYIRLCLTALLDAGYGRGAFRLDMYEAYALMSDEIAGTAASCIREVFKEFQDLAPLADLPVYASLSKALARPEAHVLRYRFYRKKFLTLGDGYGDCTAVAPSNQIDTRVTNIHWTVYPWLLNPYYRVLEVCRPDSRGLIKAHIAPLVIDGRRVLMVDAIESIPALRREAYGRSATETARHADEGLVFNERFFEENAHPAFFALMERCVELGRAIGVDAVYADMYSNAVWIRELLEKYYDHDSYHTVNVEVPFSNYEVEDNLDLIKKNAGIQPPTPRTRMEIQALNVSLMHQGAHANYKIVAVLAGLRDDWKVRVRAL
ncbi:hypothetical protein LJC31_06610 [Synergistaceae bacterium OttesenSCG-928-I11]|nr:hypothetical protein [Synergistaceae bacterium OttesenSCG-928-I11]